MEGLHHLRQRLRASPGEAHLSLSPPQDTSAYIRCKYTLMSLKKIKLIYKYVAYFLTNIYPPTQQLRMVSSAWFSLQLKLNPAAVSIPYSDLASDGSSKYSETESKLIFLHHRRRRMMRRKHCLLPQGEIRRGLLKCVLMYSYWQCSTHSY